MPHAIEPLIGSHVWAFIEGRFSEHAKRVLADVVDFVENECLPVELAGLKSGGRTMDEQITAMEDLKRKARKRGLWNLFLSQKHYPKHGVPLTTFEYAVMCEVTGRCGLAPQAMNCSAPDTGNMEVLAKYGTPYQQDKWLKPLMDGTMRSSFAMTEKGISSSDATNIASSIVQDGNEIVINGRKHWTSGSSHPENGMHIFCGKSDPKNPSPHRQQSIVIVPIPHPGVTIVRPQRVLGFHDAPGGHCEVLYENVRVPIENLVAGWGRGFEVMQGRLGPGRTHHCMRGIGMATRSIDLMLLRATDPKRTTFGKQLYEHGSVLTDLANARLETDQARFIVLNAALAMDLGDAKTAMKEISQAKIAVVRAVQYVVDRAMQVHGGEGLDEELPLAHFWAQNRALRFADGPDEVHLQLLGKAELKRKEYVHAASKEVHSRAAALGSKGSKL